MKRGVFLPDWRSVRMWEAGTRHELRQRYWLAVHGWIIGLLVLAAMWSVAHLQRVLGLDSLALRYAVTLGFGYLVFLALLRLWGGAIARRERMDGQPDGIDGGGGGGGGGGGSGEAPLPQGPGIRSGQGGDFGGGGAEGSFELDAGAADASSVIGDVASGAVEGLAGADEGIVVVVPVLAVFLLGCAIVLGAGSLLLLYFGSEVLLAVAVELAFSYVSARTAVRIAREGWLTVAVALTWKPLAGALFFAVLLGALIDTFLPAAQSLPHAVQLLRQL